MSGRAMSSALVARNGPHYSVGGVVFLIVLLMCAVGAVAVGVMAYTGRWHSWYPHGFGLPYTPFVATWFSGAVLWVAVAAIIDALAHDAPSLLIMWPFLPAMISLVIALIYTIYPPPQLLPKWIRWLNEDPGITQRPASLEAHRNSKFDAFMSKILPSPGPRGH